MLEHDERNLWETVTVGSDDGAQYDAAATESLRAKLAALEGACCQDCASRLCGHEGLYSIALGLQARPRCLSCLAQNLGRTVEQLEQHLGDHFVQRSCYRTVWNEETARDSACRRVQRLALESRVIEEEMNATPSAHELAAELSADDVWDAGGMSCGDLVLALRLRLKALPAGAVLRLTATDPGAPEDIPAWCRLTGHALLRSEPPNYFIRRKDG